MLRVSELEFDKGNWLFFELENNNEKLSSFAFIGYNSADADLYIQDLRTYLQLYSKYHTAFVIGGIKIDNLCARPDRSITEYLSLLCELKFIPANNKCTKFIPSFSPACIEHIFVMTPQNLYGFQILELQANITDHNPTMLSNKLYRNLSNMIPNSCRKKESCCLNLWSIKRIYGN